MKFNITNTLKMTSLLRGFANFLIKNIPFSARPVRPYPLCWPPPSELRADSSLTTPASLGWQQVCAGLRCGEAAKPQFSQHCSGILLPLIKKGCGDIWCFYLFLGLQLQPPISWAWVLCLCPLKSSCLSPGHLTFTVKLQHCQKTESSSNSTRAGK